MKGAELLVESAIAAGVEVCFANAGTTELPIVLALDSRPRVRPVLGLFEGVCTGAADGYGRMRQKPALVLLHLGPGLANGIANLHNAKKARTPVLNVVGEHATWHRSAGAPLAMDIEPLARTVSGWCRTNESPASLARDFADAVGASMRGQVSTLIVPNDHLWAECPAGTMAVPRFSLDPVEERCVERAAQLLRGHAPVALILGGGALHERGLKAAARVQAAVNCDLLAETFTPYVDRGQGLPDVRKIPYFPERGIELVSRYRGVVLAGAREPVTFFGYTGIRSHLLADDQPRVHLTTERQDAAEALEHLADLLNAPSEPRVNRRSSSKRRDLALPQGALTAEAACQTVALLQPEGAIIVDEGITSSLSYFALTASAPRHTVLFLAGGSIGFGMPCATGAAIACPDRPVVNIEADGSAMYTLQSLWTQARESLNVTTLVCSNRGYRILRLELERMGLQSGGPATSALIDLERPNIDWVKAAEGLGVPGVRVDTAEGLARELRRALREPGPHLIEMVLADQPG